MTEVSSGGKNRTKPEQIPKEDVSGETQRVISEQGGTEGQRKEVNLESYSEANLLASVQSELLHFNRLCRKNFRQPQRSPSDRDTDLRRQSFFSRRPGVGNRVVMSRHSCGRRNWQV